jgi:hypothetical protein
MAESRLNRRAASAPSVIPRAAPGKLARRVPPMNADKRRGILYPGGIEWRPDRSTAVSVVGIAVTGLHRACMAPNCLVRRTCHGVGGLYSFVTIWLVEVAYVCESCGTEIKRTIREK